MAAPLCAADDFKEASGFRNLTSDNFAQSVYEFAQIEVYVRTAAPSGPSPRVRALLGAAVPLLIVLTYTGNCNLDWPSTTHHVLYRNVWSDALHEDYLASQSAEAPKK